MIDRPQFMPADTPDYMAPAWLGCMKWAIGNQEMRAAFEADTGMHWTPPRTGLDKAIDDATGHSDRYVRAFVAWANANVWGPMDGENDDA